MRWFLVALLPVSLVGCGGATTVEQPRPEAAGPRVLATPPFEWPHFPSVDERYWKVDIASVTELVWAKRQAADGHRDEVVETPAGVITLVGNEDAVRGVRLHDHRTCAALEFTLVPTASASATALAKAADSGLYGCRGYACSFTRLLPAQSVAIPATWMLLDPEETITGVVIELDVFLSGDGVPQPVEPEGRPVLVVTNKGLFDVAERGYKVCPAGITTVRAASKFALTRCPRPELQSCEERLWAAFAEVATEILTRPPFAASELLGNREPRHREFERVGPSAIHRGRLVEQVRYTADLVLDRSEVGVRAGYKLEVVVTVKKNNNPRTHFRDTTSDELDRYRRALARQDIVRPVCAKVGGTMNDDVCSL